MRFKLRSRSLAGRATVALLVAGAGHACLPTPLEKSTAMAPKAPLIVTGSAAPNASVPLVSALGRSRPLPSKTEPLAAVVDFAWKGNTVSLRLPGDPTPSADGGSAGGDISLSGIGEGGGGRGEGIGLGAIGTIGHGSGAGSGAGFGSGAGLSGAASGGFGSGFGRLSGSHRTSDSEPAVRTGEWDDDANYIEFQRYLGTAASSRAAKLDVKSRRFFVVRDAEGRAVPNCRVGVDGLDARGETLASVTLTTTSNGRAIFFPSAEIPEASSFIATAQCIAGEGHGPSQTFDTRASDALVKLDLSSDRPVASDQTVDVAFILDTTGSMSEEIAAVTATIEKVATVLSKKGLTVRIGLVEYRDRTDAFVARVHPMTRDVAGFVSEVRAVRAGGGGDTPEDVNTGLSVAIDELAWSQDSVARLAFLIGDAPPHLDYPGEASYVEPMKRASHDGIQLFTVAASGMDDMGQTVFRQIAMYTGATNLFVMRGGAGPQSVGGGDPKSSCGGTQKIFRTADLDKLIAGKVERAIQLVDEDPMKVPGLGADELAKPCRPAP